MIEILVGDDQYSIQRRIAAHKAKLNPVWYEIDYHRFSSAELETAITTAISLSLSGGRRLVIVEEGNFNQWGTEQLEILQSLSAVPPENTLVFVAATLDKRLKVSKQLLKQGKLYEFNLIPPWRTDLIAEAIDDQAQELGVQLSKRGVEYLALAIGNDLVRAHSELNKLATYAQGETLSLATVQALVPCQTQNSLQLADAIRTGNTTGAAIFLTGLIDRCEPMMAIVATLLTQFRTWLWVKSAIKAGVENAEIAQLCNLNPKRLYYLRQEVAEISLGQLIKAVILLHRLESAIKNGLGTNLLPSILKITQLFV